MSESRLISAGHIAPDPAWRMRAHAHAFHEVIAVVRGRMQVRFPEARREVSAGAGEILIYQAGRRHEERSDPESPVDMYYAAFEHPEFRGRELPVMVRDWRGRTALLASWLCDEIHSAEAGREGAAGRILDCLVAEALRAAAETGAEHGLAAGTRQFMRRELAGPLTLDALAGQAGLSRYHFIRRFKAATGRTPMQELRLLRLQYAKSLILATDLPLKAIAPLAGLGDEYHLSRLFRRHLGCPPGALRGSRR